MPRNSKDPIDPKALADLAAFYSDLDRAMNRVLQATLALHCGPGCADCCTDDLTVFEIEAVNIRMRFHSVLLDDPAPPGRCAFLDEQSRCRIYPRRPYVCRTQGLPLRWQEPGASLVERRDICPQNEPIVDLMALAPDSMWTLGPFEARLAMLQRALRSDPGALSGQSGLATALSRYLEADQTSQPEAPELQRVALRELFSPADATF